MAYQTVPADSDRAVTRSATSGFQNPTTDQERHERAIAARCRFLLTLSCRELFDREHDRGELACCECLNRRYYLPGAQAKGRWTEKKLKGMFIIEPHLPKFQHRAHLPNFQLPTILQNKYTKRVP